MKKILYHGTTGDNAREILKNGFKDTFRTWNVSDNDNIYFYDLHKMAAEECLDDDFYESEKFCITRAMENAQITAAAQKYNKTDLIVLKIEIDEDYVNDDDSCDNMSTASQVSIENINSQCQITAAFKGDCFMPSLAGIIFMSMLDREECYVNDDYYSEMELNILRSLNMDLCEASCAFLDMITWEEMDI